MTTDVFIHPVLWLLAMTLFVYVVLEIHKHGLPKIIRWFAWELWALASGIEQGWAAFQYARAKVKESAR